ncbi:MAG: hypothetical protein HY244_10150 [Rhizobiales bacterium]|nr:hypothetical protein [Hyphomicrobiales bacterium]
MKRSSQVALLLMGVTGAGTATYAVMPTRDCVAPNKPAALAPGAINPQTLAPGGTPAVAPGVTPNAQQAVPCQPSRRSSWYYRSYWSGRNYGYSSSPTQPTARRSLFSPSSSHTSVPSVGHRSGSGSSGFGSTGHSVSGHSSGT